MAEEKIKHPYQSIATLVGLAGKLFSEEAQKCRSLEIVTELKKRPHRKFKAGLQTLQMLSCCALAPRPVSAELLGALAEVLGVARHRTKRMFRASLNCKSVTEAADEFCISTATAYRWRADILADGPEVDAAVESAGIDHLELERLLERFRSWHGSGMPPGLCKRLFDAVASQAERKSLIEEPFVLLVLGEALRVLNADRELTQMAEVVLFGRRRQGKLETVAVLEGEALFAQSKISTDALAKEAKLSRNTVMNLRRTEGYQLSRLATQIFARLKNQSP